MSIRATLLQIAATPDRAWLTLLAGSMLLAREFVAPGRVVPGVLGGLGLIVGIYGLSAFGINPTGLALFVATLAILISQAWWPRWAPGAVAAALVGTATARLLLAPPFQISVPAALATAPAAFLLAWLLFMARRAYNNKVRTAEDLSR
ncbi:MAG: hypothetical protein SGI92_33685 [Bryobacteraceae bacterium]|nr:hypothetical protein [Bryobacteraceae bacterium]